MSESATSVPSSQATPPAPETREQLDILETSEQVTAQQTEQPVKTDTPKPDNKAEQSESSKGFDKIRQQVQQEIGNKMRPLEAKLDQLMSAIEKQGGKPTQEQKAQIQNVKDDLEDIGDVDSDTFDPYKATPRIAKALQAHIRKQNERIASLERQQQATVSAVEPAMQTAYRQQWTRWFKTTNPELASKADDAFDLFEKHRGELSDPSEPVPPATAQRIAKHAYELSLKALTSDDKPKDKPLSSKPDKEPEGTTVVSSSSAGRAAPKQTREPTDRELIEGILITNTD